MKSQARWPRGAGLLLIFLLGIGLSPLDSKASRSMGDDDLEPDRVRFYEDLAQSDPEARWELAKYFQRYGDQTKAAYWFRKIVFHGPKKHMLTAMSELVGMKRELRLEFPEITDELYERNDKSVGVALFNMGKMEQALDVLIREAWLLDTAAQMTLETLYRSPMDELQPFKARVLEYYEKSSIEGMPRSQLVLGRALLFSEGVSPDPERGTNLLKSSRLPDAYVLLVQYAMEQKNPELADRYISEVPIEYRANLFYELGVRALGNNQQQAKRYFEQAIAFNPPDYRAMLNVAAMYTEGWGTEKNERKGFLLMQRVAQEADGEIAATARANLGLYYLKGVGTEVSRKKGIELLFEAAMAGVEQARQLFIETVNEEPISDEQTAAHASETNEERAESYFNHGLAFRIQGNVVEAKAMYEEAIRLNPKDFRPYMNLGGVLKSLGDHTGAISAFLDAITLKPDMATLHFNLGSSLNEKGDRAGAIVAFQEAIRLEPSAMFYDSLGLTFFAQGDFHSAAAAFKEAVLLNPEDANFQQRLGAALNNIGDRAGAIAAFEKAIRLDPSGPQAISNLEILMALRTEEKSHRDQDPNANVLQESKQLPDEDAKETPQPGHSITLDQWVD